MTVKQGETVLLEDVRLLFRNFSGKQGAYNAAGDRNFSVIIPDEMVEKMVADGWNVKFLKPRDEGDEPTPTLPVKVEYEKGRPPRCVLISGKRQVDLGAGEVELLDAIEIARADLIIRAYVWNVNENSGVKAYLKTAYITMVVDELEERYGEAAADLQPAGDLADD